MVLMCGLYFMCVVFGSLETPVITVWELLGAVEHILADGKNHFILSDWLLNVRMDEGGGKSNG